MNLFTNSENIGVRTSIIGSLELGYAYELRFSESLHEEFNFINEANMARLKYSAKVTSWLRDIRESIKIVFVKHSHSH